ncbi:MAG: hypothetical protein AAF731_18080 [Bacteroidota bacterium]
MKDESYSLEKYYELGIKKIDQTWEYKDYLTASKIIIKLKKESQESIPRKNSVDSGLLFSKLINDQALEVLSELELPDIELDRAEIYNNLVDIYIEPGDGYQPYNDECTEILTFGFKLNIKAYSSVLYAIDTAGIKENEEVQKIVEPMKKGLIRQSIEYIEGLETSQLSQKNIVINAVHLTEVFPSLFALLKPLEIELLLEKIESQSQKHSQKEVRRVLKNFLAQSGLPII